MKISTRMRYGLRLMCVLAVHYGKGKIDLKTISGQEEISEKYLSQIIIPLKNRGMVASVRGAGGGYTLNKKPKDITLKDIYEAIEGSIDIITCTKDDSVCSKTSECVTRTVWAKVNNAIADTLENITLKDLAVMREKSKKRGITYNI